MTTTTRRADARRASSASPCRRSRPGRCCSSRPISRSSWPSWSSRSATPSGWRAIRSSMSSSSDDPIFLRTVGEHAGVPDRRHQREDGDRAVPVGLLHPQALVGEGPGGAVRAALGGAVDPDHPLGPLHAQSRMGRDQPADLQADRRRRPELAERPDARAVAVHGGAHLEVAAVLDPDPAGRPARHPGRALRGRLGRRRRRAGIASPTSPGRRSARSTSPARCSR